MLRERTPLNRLLAGYLLVLGSVGVCQAVLDEVFGKYGLSWYLGSYWGKAGWENLKTILDALHYLWWWNLRWVVFVVCGLALRSRPHKSKLIVSIACAAELIGAVFGTLRWVLNWMERPGGYTILRWLEAGTWEVHRYALPFAVLWIVWRQGTIQQPWRVLLAAWLILNGVAQIAYGTVGLFDVGNDGAFSVSLTHPGWRTIGWASAPLVMYLFGQLAAVFGIAGGVGLLFRPDWLKRIVWITSVASALFAVAFGLVCGLVNTGSWTASMCWSNYQFDGFQNVSFDDVLFAILHPAMMLPLYVCLIVFAHRQTVRMKREQRLCMVCGYNLTGNTSGVCPECGTACR